MLTNLPNLLTLSRILVIPPIVALFFMDGETPRWVALGLYAAACVTDFFDGYIARSMGQISKFGRFMDPVADKLLVAAVIFMLVATDRIAGLVVLPALIILIREILVSGLREHLAALSVGVAGQPAGQMEDDDPNVRARVSDRPRRQPGLDSQRLDRRNRCVDRRIADPDHRLGLSAGRAQAFDRRRRTRSAGQACTEEGPGRRPSRAAPPRI